MPQFVVDIKNPRPTPISMEECVESGLDMGRYDLCLAMAQAARRIQRQRNKSIRRGLVSYGQPNEYKNPFDEEPVISAMRLAKEYT